MAALRSFREATDTLSEVDFFYYTALVMRTETIFLTDHDDYIKNLLLSDTPNTFTKLEEYGYQFFFINDPCKAAIERNRSNGYDNDLYDFVIQGTDLYGITKIYKSPIDLLLLSFSPVVWALGCNSFHGLVEIETRQEFLKMMDYIFEEYIEPRGKIHHSCP